MSSLLSSNLLIAGLYKSSVLNRTPFQKFYHILNLDNTQNHILNYNRHDIINTFQPNIKWGKSSVFSQISLLSSDNMKKNGTKNQNKTIKTNVKQNSNSKKTEFKNSNDTLSYRQQQQLNQIRHQIQNQQYMQKPTPIPRYDNVKSKGSNNTVNSTYMSSLSTNKPTKSVTVGKSSVNSSHSKYSSPKAYNSNYMYNQDIDGKTMFQQQIYNNTSFNNPREVIF